ncbi:MAG: phosphomethylpyrimidine kinase [Treponema sp.]|nr:MAG: phosphomethylpyrimidine kinase [Treponema sp.]
MSKKILLVTDSVSYGKLGMSAQVPVLSRMGYDVYNLPTALVSNNFGYPDYEMLLTTAYMKRSVEIWQAQGFSFDAISIGFVATGEQAGIIRDLVEFNKKKNPDLIVTLDPIMGDDGQLYHGLGEENVNALQSVCKFADVITPNFTEACFLADMLKGKTSVSEDEAKSLAEKLHNDFSTECVITSTKVGNKNAIETYTKDACELSFYEEVPVAFSGTGDFFSAYFLGTLLKGVPIVKAAEEAGKFVKDLVAKYAGQEDKLVGIAVEEYLQEMNM